MSPYNFLDGIFMRMANRSDGGGLVRMPVYKKNQNHKDFKALKKSKGLTIREVCAALSITYAEELGLESGRYDLSKEDWDRLLTELRKA